MQMLRPYGIGGADIIDCGCNTRIETNAKTRITLGTADHPGHTTCASSATTSATMIVSGVPTRTKSPNW